MICIIRGATDSAIRIGNDLRTAHVSSGRGALLVRETEQGELPVLMEKIIIKDKWPDKPDVNNINWKRDPVIILIGSKGEMLLEFEKACPGFVAKFGPLYVLNIDEPTLEESKNA